MKRSHAKYPIWIELREKITMMEASYRRKFLKNNPQGRRVQVYIDRSLHEQIKRFLPAVAPDVSLSSYITNIVEEHFERYIDEINRRYEKSFSLIKLNAK